MNAKTKPLSNCLLFTIVLFYCLAPTAYGQSQLLVNKSWSNTRGNPASGIEWSASIADGLGNIYTTGNNVDNNLNVNLSLYKQNATGVLDWEIEYSNGIPNTKSYGVGLAFDNNGNIIIAGAIFDPLVQSHDYLILKYNPQGVLQWSQTYGSSGNNDDIPTSLALDANGNIYITGSTFNTATNYDYLTVKVNNSGITQWAKEYDYNALGDAALAIKVKGSGSNTKVMVTGGSASTLIDWDFANLIYGTDGTILNTLRTGATGTGLEIPTSLTTDASGNYYITGYGGVTGQPNKAYTVKLDQDFNLLWEKWYSGESLDTKAHDVEIDNSGNSYVCGYVEKLNGGHDYFLIKYDVNGNKLWVKRRNARDRTQSAKAYFLAIDNNGYIAVTGEEIVDGASYLRTIQYDSNSKLLWENIHDGHTTGSERPTGMLVTNTGDLIVSALMKDGSSRGYEKVKYTTTNYTPTHDYDENNIAINVDKEILVRFSPKVIDTTFADNTGLTYGTVEEIITDQSLIVQMDVKLNAGGTLKDWRLIKLSPSITTNNAFTTNRYGEIMPIPPFWATYKLIMETNMKESIACDQLETLPSWQIWWADVNQTVHQTTPNIANQPPPPPDDPYYATNQGSLNPLLNAVAHINVEPVWDRGITGSENITVAVFDTGISFEHEDFMGDGSYSGLGGSVVEGGADATGGSWTTVMNDNSGDNNAGDNSHGSMCAGIIGALRNNSDDNGEPVGISGIAGGDIDGIDGPAHRGVKLQAYKVGDDISLGKIEKAMAFMLSVDGAPPNTERLPLADISSHSYSWDPNATGENPEIIEEEFYTAFSAGQIVVVSRGNEGIDDDFLPSTFNPNWYITVGGSGTDGKYKNSTNGVQPGQSTDVDGEMDDLSASYGSGLDLIAPATKLLIKTTNNGDEDAVYPNFWCPEGTDPEPQPHNKDYTCHYGVSAAVPHVAGAAALVMEYHELNHDGVMLHYEDVESLLNYGATDVFDLEYGESYDEKNGWGLLNVEGSISLIDAALDRKIYHLPIIPALDPSSCTDPDVGCEVLFFESPYINPETGTIYEVGIGYEANRRKYIYDISLNVCDTWDGVTMQTLDHPNKVPVWGSRSRSTLWVEQQAGTNGISLRPEKDFQWEVGPAVSANGCTVTGQISGFAYEIITGGDTPNEFIPNTGVPDEFPRVFVSLLVNDPNRILPNGGIVLETKENEIEKRYLTISPNPGKDQFTLYYNTKGGGNTSIRITDVSGKSILSLTYPDKAAGNHEEVVDLTSFPNGIYFCQLQNNNTTVTRKLIKQ